ncbi:MAG TPA: response regulator [Nitrospira sp.]|nr:response regulator [Nitrospira sp.]
MPSVLIVDDIPSFHEMLDVVVQPVGFSTAFATDGPSALERFKKEKFDLVLVDYQMMPMDGITVLREIKRIDPNAIVIIMTAHAAKSNAMAALKYGAFDFLQKPFRVDELVAALRRALEFRQNPPAKPVVPKAQAAVGPVVSTASVSSEITERVELLLTGESRKIKRIGQQIKRLLESRTPVLIQGEAGTGKKAVAEYVHGKGPTAEGGLVRYDCSLVEKEEFHDGLIGPSGLGGKWMEGLNGGTLLLENIHAMPAPVQRDFASVLRASGSTFRLISSSTVDLEKLSEQKKFNDELFFRMAALPVVLPALRERAEDIPALVKAVAATVSNPQFPTGRIEFTSDAMSVLSNYYWPGNLSELVNVIGRIVSAAETRVITAEQLPLNLHELKDYPSLEDHMREQRQEYVASVLAACNGDKDKAAKVLGCDPAEVA